MEKQNHEIRFKCTKEELTKLKQRCKAVGMTMKGYLLHLGLKTRINIKVE